MYLCLAFVAPGICDLLRNVSLRDENPGAFIISFGELLALRYQRVRFRQCLLGCGTRYTA